MVSLLFRDSDRDKAIQSLDSEIERLRSVLKQEVEEQDTEKQK